MRITKLLTLFSFVLILFASCQKEAPRQIVFYSVDQLKKDLPIMVSDTEGNTISVNSNAVVNLNSSKVFEKNINLLKDVEVEKFSFKIKNFTINPLAKFSNIEIYVDELKITGNDIKFDFLSILNNGLDFEIDNQEILSKVSSKLLQKKQVVISYYSDAVTDKLFNFDLEFLLTTKATFVD